MMILFRSTSLKSAHSVHSVHLLYYPCYVSLRAIAQTELVYLEQSSSKVFPSAREHLNSIRCSTVLIRPNRNQVLDFVCGFQIFKQFFNAWPDPHQVSNGAPSALYYVGSRKHPVLFRRFCTRPPEVLVCRVIMLRIQSQRCGDTAPHTSDPRLSAPLVVRLPRRRRASKSEGTADLINSDDVENSANSSILLIVH
jgi:hypothetical protein